MPTFTKKERLTHQKVIAELFEKGNALFCFPLKIVWLRREETEQDFPAQVSFSVAKRKFKKAVVRNLLKRRMREAYRKNKQFLYDGLETIDSNIVLMIIYVDKNILDYATIEAAMVKALKLLVKKCGK